MFCLLDHFLFTVILSKHGNDLLNGEKENFQRTVIVLFSVYELSIYI